MISLIVEPIVARTTESLLITRWFCWPLWKKSRF